MAENIITTAVGTGKRGFAGDGGQATAALLNGPFDIAFDAALGQERQISLGDAVDLQFLARHLDAPSIIIARSAATQQSRTTTSLLHEIASLRSQ